MKNEADLRGEINEILKSAELFRNSTNGKISCPHCNQDVEAPSEVSNAVAACPACNREFNPMKELEKAMKTFSVDQANKIITHGDFVTGIQNRTMSFKCLYGEPSELLRGARLAIFNILVLLYTVGPFILAPLWAFHEHNWLLLIGIVVACAATRISVYSLCYFSEKMYSISGWLLFAFTCYCVGHFWIHNYYTWFMLCALWGFMLFRIAEKTQNRFAIQSLIESPELFEYAVNQGKIMMFFVEKEKKVSIYDSK